MPSNTKPPMRVYRYKDGQILESPIRSDEQNPDEYLHHSLVEKMVRLVDLKGHSILLEERGYMTDDIDRQIDELQKEIDDAIKITT